MKLKNGKYTISKQLGQGGFGITYLATTPVEVKGKINGKSKTMTVEAPVVVKEFFLKEYCARGADNTSVNVLSIGVADMVNKYRDKFKKEALKLSQMEHPNIVEVTDVIEDENNTSYYVMRYLNGGTLYQLVRPDEKTVRPLSESRALKYIKQIADALKYMHKRGMCHFDVKPNNIMLDENDNAILIDFGLAKNYSKDGQQTSSLLVGASVGYAPLEQANANLETFSPQTDIYALGATLYFLLTGHKPKAAAFNMSEVLPNGQCGISDTVWSAIIKSMQANPKDRPINIDAFLLLLNSQNNETIVISNNQKPVTVSPKPVTPNFLSAKEKVLLWSACVIFGVVIISLIAYFVDFSSVQQQLTQTVIMKTDSMSRSVEKDDIDGDILLVHREVTNLEIKDKQGKLLYTYTGKVIDGMPDGENGTAIYPSNDPENKERFEGSFSNGKRIKGQLYWRGGVKYDGLFENDQLSNGKYTLVDGSYYDGTFKDNKPYNGTWYNRDGSIYIKVLNGK